jgi:hypothetical protein
MVVLNKWIIYIIWFATGILIGVSLSILYIENYYRTQLEDILIRFNQTLWNGTFPNITWG